MKKEFIKIADAVAIGSWEDVDNLPLSSITKNDADVEKISGLVIKGYETKFNGTNTNGERYGKDCLDNFLQSYFVDNKLNIPVTLLHRDDIDHLCGRVLIVEVNSVGFYFVAYVPRTYVKYEQVKNLLKEGILQGFSKEGWATDYDCKYKENGEFDYYEVKEFELINVSLVATPANAVTFEKVQEIKIENSTAFRKEPEPEKRKKLYN